MNTNRVMEVNSTNDVICFQQVHQLTLIFKLFGSTTICMELINFGFTKIIFHA